MSLLKDDVNDEHSTFYLPHHSVLKKSSLTTKLRVVFDASAKTTNGVSLNDILMVGPIIQQDLLSILARYRTHKYVISADITKMYRRILVSDSDRRFQRIFWRPDASSEVQTYQLNTVTYGTAPASFLAIRCLHHLAREYERDFPLGAAAILRDFYVDDFLSGGSDENKIICIRNQVISILQKDYFELRKWTSNNINLLHGLQDQIQNTILNVDKDYSLKTLGLQCSSHHDVFLFTKSNGSDLNKITKRSILFDVSKIFDPLGFLTPVIVVAKILLQKLWQQKLGWDESVSQDVHTKWFFYRQSLRELNNLKIPRNVIPVSSYNILEVHGFSDASELAYGACLYVRVLDTKGTYHSNLLCSKSRVAPLKSITIPGLELCASVLLSHLLTKTISILNLSVGNIYLWTDSTIVLSWIRSSSRLFNTFVANRIGERHKLTDISFWQYVKTAENPADFISRVVDTISIINNNLWWHGPTWLQLNEIYWPKVEPQGFNSEFFQRSSRDQKICDCASCNGSESF